MKTDFLLTSEEAYLEMRKKDNKEIYSEGVKEILEPVQQSIQKAINNGIPRCTTHFNFYCGMKEKQRDNARIVIEILRHKGYEAGIEEYERNIPLKPDETFLDLKCSLHFCITVDFEPSFWWKIKRFFAEKLR